MKYLIGKPGAIALLVFGLVFPFLTNNEYHLYVMTLAFIFALAASGLNLITGFTGQLNLAHAGFMAIGAYAVGILQTKAGWPFWAAFPMSAIVTGVLGFLIGIVSLRLKEHYFAIFTLSVGFIIFLLIEKWESLTEGHNGIFGIEPPEGFFGIDFYTPIAQYYLALLFLALGLLLMWRIVNSLLGRTFMAIRNSDELAEALGINLMRNKVLSFTLSTIYAGVAGGLYTGVVRFLGPDMAQVVHTFDMITYMLVGGIGTLFGPLVGTMIITWLTQYLQFLADYRMIVFGPLLVLLVIFFPYGIVGYLRMRQMRRALAEADAKAGLQRQGKQAASKEVGNNA